MCGAKEGVQLNKSALGSRRVVLDWIEHGLEQRIGASPLPHTFLKLMHTHTHPNAHLLHGRVRVVRGECMVFSDVGGHSLVLVGHTSGLIA